MPPYRANITNNHSSNRFSTATQSTSQASRNMRCAKVYRPINVWQVTWRTVPGVILPQLVVTSLQQQHSWAKNFTHSQDNLSCCYIQGSWGCLLQINIIPRTKPTHLWPIATTSNRGIAQGIAVLCNGEVLQCHGHHPLEQLRPLLTH
jgi:hypothetical protein